MRPIVLLIEDEAAIADTLRYALGTEGFDVRWHALGREGLAALALQPALVILDVGLPDLSGFEVCKLIRRQSDVPVLFLTARSDEVDRVVGLEIGGDDYVSKPFSPREVCARVKAILKRVKAPTGSGPFELDAEGARVRYQGRLLELTRHEFALLKTLLAAPGRIFSRNQLMHAAWPDSEAYDRTVDTHIKTLRKKLQDIDPTAEPIETHRGMGYSLKVA